MTLRFHLACVPPRASHHAKRIVRVGSWTRLADKPELVATKQLLDVLLLPHRPPQPMTGPLALDLEFTWPWLRSDPKRTRALGRVPHDRKPDCSNVLKTFEDRLKVLSFMTDDAQICDVRVRKWRGDTPGIAVTLTGEMAP